MSVIWFLKDVNLYKILCPHKYQQYKEGHAVSIFSKKEFIYLRHDKSDKIYLIEKGKVKLGYYNDEGEEVVNSILTKGEIFGEKAILGEQGRNEFAQCIDNDNIICTVNLKTMHDLMRDNESFSLKIFKIIGFKIKKIERRLELLLYKDAKTRLIEFLNELSKDYGYLCKENDFVIKHPYTQKDIASLIGVSRPTLNVLLNELKSNNIIDFNRKTITIIKNNRLVLAS